MPSKSMQKIMDGVDKIAAKLSEQDKMAHNHELSIKDAARDDIMRKRRVGQADEEELADKLARNDRADVDKITKRNAAYKTSLGNVPAYPKEYGKPSTKAEIMHAADAAERQHLDNSTWGGMGEKAYNMLQSKAKKIREANKVPNKDPNKGLRDTKEARDKAYYGNFKDNK